MTSIILLDPNFHSQSEFAANYVSTIVRRTLYTHSPDDPYVKEKTFSILIYYLIVFFSS